jgi:Tfp pilus assembly protein PilE
MAHASRGEVGRTEILVAVAVLAVLTLIVVPVIWSFSRSSRRAEVPLNVEAIRLTELSYHKAFTEFLSADAAPRPPHAVDAEAVPWVPSDGFRRLGWAPADAEVRGSYSVTANKTGFVVHGACDVDGDGHRALYQADADHEAAATTDNGVY